MKKVGCTIPNSVGFIHQMPTRRVYGYGKKNWGGCGPRKVSGPISTRMILLVGSITSNRNGKPLFYDYLTEQYLFEDSSIDQSE